jgi:hypothetical protein
MGWFILITLCTPLVKQFIRLLGDENEMPHFSYSVYIALKFQLRSTPCSPRTQPPKYEYNAHHDETRVTVCGTSPLRGESELERTLSRWSAERRNLARSPERVSRQDITGLSRAGSHFQYKIVRIYNLPMPQRTSLETNVVLTITILDIIHRPVF